MARFERRLLCAASSCRLSAFGRTVASYEFPVASFWERFLPHIRWHLRKA